jgi:hypothetical protein
MAKGGGLFGWGSSFAAPALLSFHRLSRARARAPFFSPVSFLFAHSHGET